MMFGEMETHNDEKSIQRLTRHTVFEKISQQWMLLGVQQLFLKLVKTIAMSNLFNLHVSNINHFVEDLVVLEY